MELNDTVMEQTNKEIDNLIHGKENNKSVNYLLSTIRNIEDVINDERRFKQLSRNDFMDISTKLNDTRRQLEFLSNIEVIDEKNQEKQWSDDANVKLADMIKQENFTEISLSQLFENFILTWTKIFLEIFDSSTYTYKNENEWWYQLVDILKRIFEIITQDDRLIYVGIGLVIASFFVYFILISS